MLDWLEYYGVQTTSEIKKGQLLKLTKNEKPSFLVFVIDELAAKVMTMKLFIALHTTVTSIL